MDQHPSLFITNIGNLNQLKLNGTLAKYRAIISAPNTMRYQPNKRKPRFSKKVMNVFIAIMATIKATIFPISNNLIVDAFIN